MNEITSQVLSIGLVTLAAFIPNDTLRYTVLVVTSLAISAYLVHHSTPCAQVKKAETSLKGIEALFSAVMKECVSDPRFIAEKGLRLATAKLSVSLLRTRLMVTKNITWKEYPSYLKNILLSIEECRREVGQSRSSMLVRHESLIRFPALNPNILVRPRVYPPAEVYAINKSEEDND
ncbi:hypothetical protein C8J57DRAFT_1491477 [Mycena rebaudengoi]|nr:hypothetical protein C8J57DRAFT_1491477 [Mycena rebaudengoi]